MTLVSTTPFFLAPISSPWDLTDASYDTVSFSVAGQDNTPLGISFKSDGTKMYVVGTSNDRVFQYSLATPWDMNTASYGFVSFSVAGQDTAPFGIFFKPDGTKMYMVGNVNSSVFQYTLSTPWVVSSASYDTVLFNFTPQDAFAVGISFKPDGTKMYMTGNGTNKVYQYTLSTPWVVSSATYDTVLFNFAAQDGVAVGISFKPDGTKMFMVGSGNDSAYQYTLSTPWVVSSATYDTVLLNFTVQDNSSAGISFKSDGTKIYMIGNQNDTVYQYSL